MIRFAGIIVALCLVAWATSSVAQISVAGRWQATELDPLFPENPLFGQYRYDVVIEGSGPQMRVTVPRTGAVYDRVKLEGSRLIAYGSDPTRGVTRLDITFSENAFEGRVFFESRPKRILGEIDPTQLARREQAKVQAARAEQSAAAQRLQAMDQTNAVLKAQLAGAEHALQLSERKLAAIEQELRQLRAAPAAPAPVARQRPVASGAERLRIEVIEPPLDGAQRAAVADHGQDKVTLVGRVRGPNRLLSLQSNGRDVAPLANGLFWLDLPRGELPASLQIVAIDVNGARSSRTLSLTLDTASAAMARSAPAALRKPAASAAATCYQLALAADPPDPTGLDACRAALKAKPDSALNHYNLGAALSRLGRHQEAVGAYREAAALWSRQ